MVNDLTVGERTVGSWVDDVMISSKVKSKLIATSGIKAGDIDVGSSQGVVTLIGRVSSEKIKSLGLQKTARIIHGDILKQDFSSADVVTVYLLPVSNERIRPLLEKQLKKGTRLVAHDFGIAGWTAEKEEQIEDDGEGRSHTLYLYRR